MAAEGFSGSDENQQARRKMLKLTFNGDRGPPTRQQQQPGQVLANMGHQTQIERLRSQSREATGKLKISPELEFDFTADDLSDQGYFGRGAYGMVNKMYHEQSQTLMAVKTFDFTADDLHDEGEIGRGAYGTVNKMQHEQSNTVMAVKRIRSTVDEKEQKQLLMDLDVVMRSSDCQYIVQFYGALFKEGDCWICMELMSISLDKFYKFVCISMNSSLPEPIIGKIACTTVKALGYLKDRLQIIHRDVKPSNILLDEKGNIKLCDFGISGQLVDSIAKTRDAGCRPYMAPERIDPRVVNQGYDVRSDVWSLGITLTEIATGKFPYPKWNSVFEQLQQVVNGEPPQLRDDGRFTIQFINFVNTCLIKEYKDRPKYNQLLRHPFILQSEQQVDVDVGTYVCGILAEMPADRSQLFLDSSS